MTVRARCISHNRSWPCCGRPQPVKLLLYGFRTKTGLLFIFWNWNWTAFYFLKLELDWLLLARSGLELKVPYFTFRKLHLDWTWNWTEKGKQYGSLTMTCSGSTSGRALIAHTSHTASMSTTLSKPCVETEARTRSSTPLLSFLKKTLTGSVSRKCRSLTSVASLGVVPSNPPKKSHGWTNLGNWGTESVRCQCQIIKKFIVSDSVLNCLNIITSYGLIVS